MTKNEKRRYNEQVRLETRVTPDNHIARLFEKKKQTTFVTCFSEVENNLLLWSHYADKHKGACIGFNTESLRSD